MIIRAEQTTQKKPYAGCTIYEYNSPSVVLTIARARIVTRYPEKGRAVNTQCEEVYYVLEGTGTIQIDNEISSIKQGDVCVIQIGKPYLVKGDLTLLIATSPPWSPEQHQNV